MKTLLLTPTDSGVGLTSICLGMIHALDQMGLRVAYFKPISFSSTGQDRSAALVEQYSSCTPPLPIGFQQAKDRIADGHIERLMEDILSLHQEVLDQYEGEEPEVMLIEGVNESIHEALFDQFNIQLARALDAQVILITTPQANSVQELNSRLSSTAKQFGGINDSRVLGTIINMLNAPLDRHGNIRPDITSPTYNAAFGHDTLANQLPVLQRDDFHLIGAIPWNRDLTAPRTADVMAYLKCSSIAQGEAQQRRVHHVVIASQHVESVVPQLQPGTLVITSHDRSDILIAVAMAQHNGVALAGLLFTGTESDNSDTLAFCQSAIEMGLPLYQVEQDTYQVVNLLPGFDNRLPVDDTQRIHVLMDTIAQNLDKPWLKSFVGSDSHPRLSPAAFRYRLVQKARTSSQRIILPEGDEPRTIQAAITCHHRRIADCILLGEPATIRQVAQSNGLDLPDGLTLLDPESIRNDYLELLMELRRHKGITEQRAKQELEDNVVLGTLMLYQDDVDGLVSGAVHTTANTIRPALQLIRTKPGVNIVSSIFFMCLPDQVLIFGDCAINPDPNAEQLADIAIESADSAHAFGITPKVAMISYSTMESGAGVDVDKVRAATQQVKKKRPDITIDGPLQYDAAIIPKVASKKAPSSEVAGSATVLIFPDLNTGNTTYKAVQRSANVVSIGPMLQGLKKPVNDLSRGANVDDIIYTVALTAIQAQETTPD
ncbi:MAG: phosphate acetyltransferase [Pseudomonadales bacterium]|nr:phosphate acetyltransferase [Pseudomonadales bacterium]MAQ27670.1 phosphate acetyltransferase [Pseudomonadales bacterium]MBI26047.1 phosphate acetyltransferase [Pseudomonadales bacterium]TNC88546.1 MAG: phosphate acetyltransferase [Alcanivorax sp.]